VKPETKQAQIDALYAGILSLKQVTGVIRIDIGTNIATRNKGYTHGFTVMLESQAALEAYAIDTFHVNIAETLVVPICEDILALDYIIG
jgi:hypothetical protein